MCCQNWPGLTWTPRPYQHTVLTLSLCPTWIARDKLNIKPMVGTCRKRSISAPELETSIHERWEQKLAKDIRKQQKIFYHSHVYIKNVGSCNFLCLFPCSLTYFMFPCSLRFFALFSCSHCQITRIPLFPKNPWETLISTDEKSNVKIQNLKIWENVTAWKWAAINSTNDLNIER